MLYTAVKQHGKPLDSTNSTWVASDRSFATVRGLDALVDAEDDVAAAAAREGAALEVRAAFAACAARGCCSMTGTLMSRPPPLGCARCRCERVRSHGVAAALAPAPAHMCVRVCMSHRETQRERETERQRERETHTHTHTQRNNTKRRRHTQAHTDTQIHMHDKTRQEVAKQSKGAATYRRQGLPPPLFSTGIAAPAPAAAGGQSRPGPSLRNRL